MFLNRFFGGSCLLYVLRQLLLVYKKFDVDYIEMISYGNHEFVNETLRMHWHLSEFNSSSNVIRFIGVDLWIEKLGFVEGVVD